MDGGFGPHLNKPRTIKHAWESCRTCRRYTRNAGITVIMKNQMEMKMENNVKWTPLWRLAVLGFRTENCGFWGVKQMEKNMERQMRTVVV